MLMSVPGQTVGVSAFTEDLLRDLAVKRDNLSLAYLVGTVTSGLMITRAGKLYDRHGARVMAFFAGLMLGLMLLYLTRIDRIAGVMQQANWISPAVATFILLSVGFWGIRFFGQGMLTMVSRNMVMKWFDKRRGMSNAFLGIFTAFGFSLAPQVLSRVIESLEWQGAWVALAFERTYSRSPYIPFTSVLPWVFSVVVSSFITSTAGSPNVSAILLIVAGDARVSSAWSNPMISPEARAIPLLRAW